MYFSLNLIRRQSGLLSEEADKPFAYFFSYDSEQQVSIARSNPGIQASINHLCNIKNVPKSSYNMKAIRRFKSSLGSTSEVIKFGREKVLEINNMVANNITSISDLDFKDISVSNSQYVMILSCFNVVDINDIKLSIDVPQEAPVPKKRKATEQPDEIFKLKHRLIRLQNSVDEILRRLPPSQQPPQPAIAPQQPQHLPAPATQQHIPAPATQYYTSYPTTTYYHGH